MDFHGLDLNLLVAFDALMQERNVTRAAAQVGVSQPAMSAALSRLRNKMSDPLFLRNAEGLQPTPRARDLAVPISQALQHIELAVVQQREFIPKEINITIKLGLSDYSAFVLLPSLMAALQQLAPDVKVAIQTFNNRDHAIDLLDAGTIDIAIGVLPTKADGRILTCALLEDEFVTIIAKEHWAASEEINLESYLELQHLLVSPEGEQYGVVDRALAQMDKKRNLVLTLPNMTAAPSIVASTNMAATILKRVALCSSMEQKLILFNPPFNLPKIGFHLIWHRRTHNHSILAWFREFVRQNVASE